ncbi:hypothetical protein F441_00462 [Phytophthora nicotianae CJ01A1]|uniref:Lipase-like C-terminal domain-containing protein n=2 Tax=Phytophthora nicotianae TaxID=4792 RepID=W2M0T3_PHYNI|nr:hypothetical protein L915_00434 [Phytophthora nicotianae]ETL50290.1 hypothetical protein L916_00437 [Phytophthora nicotianae]ETM03348.1 hypothetical protein L917_00411 [Phytophthora nicotianae]ETP26932.1 hypothetical protein F441_00462 [Phytophthora nicotianae CJ01A1]
MSARTKFPVVLIHGKIAITPSNTLVQSLNLYLVLYTGVFGFGKQRPLWGHWVPYWPERELNRINPNHLLVDVGSVSSDHDRACEVFYQLVGGRVDYGEQHSNDTGHDRYGEMFDNPLHPNWSEDNPVHLLGHSFGSTTAIELFQLLSTDFFQVGSSHKWVASITCIAGPLTGSTLTHMIGMETSRVVPGGIVHLMSIVFGAWIQLYWKFPILKNAADLRMDQWNKYSLKDLLVANGPVTSSGDLVVHGTIPEYRISRNAQLENMDKLHLLSITTSPKTVYRPFGEGMALAVLVLLRWNKFPKWWPGLARRRGFRAFASFLVVCYLWFKLKKLDVSKMPSMYGLKWLIRRRARSLPMIFDGFEAGSWEHNDGVVNIRSMLRPWFPKPQEMERALSSNDLTPPAPSLPATSSSSSLKDTALARCESHISIDGFNRDTDDEQQTHGAKRFEKGRWYVYRVDSNHLAGTYWDSNAADLYKSLFTLMSKEYEREDSKTSGVCHQTNRHTTAPFYS